MSWSERAGRVYHRRSEWVDGRAMKVYVGSGEAAVEAKESDRVEREQRVSQAWAWQAEESACFAASLKTAAAVDACALFARAVLVASGFHRHDRGPWRRRRG
ncbi:MAG: hypothetical protein U0835_16055 [Isosphaeraceae bacterium]